MYIKTNYQRTQVVISILNSKLIEFSPCKVIFPSVSKLVRMSKGCHKYHKLILLCINSSENSQYTFQQLPLTYI